MTGSGSESPLLGREEERKALDTLLGSVRDGLSSVLVLVGEAGIGKTRMLEYAAGAAADLRVSRLVGAEAEARLGFAALHRLLLPFMGLAERLPTPQREALDAAFGLRGGPRPDRFLVGLACLTLLSEAAEARPLLCLVDDAQWLDRDSVEVLAFVGRRLHADGIGLLICVRDGDGSAWAGLPSLRLSGLEELDARDLLAVSGAGRLPSGTVARVVAETGGNPLALLELAGELAGRPLPPAPLPLGLRLEEHFLRQVRALPGRTQALLLVVSLVPAGDSILLWRAADRLGLAATAADDAITAGILSDRPLLSFRHPLIRSAVHGGAQAADRRRVHAALAEVIDPGRDPDRRAWHLAEATAGIDEDVASQLVAASERARARGGYSAQAMFLSRAAELTADPRIRAGEQVAAAQAYVMAGEPGVAQRLLDLSTVQLSAADTRAEAVRLNASIEMAYLRVAAVPSILATAVPESGSLRRLMRLEAMQAALLARGQITDTTLADVARSLLAAPPAGRADVRPVDALAVRVLHGWEQAVPALRSAITALLTDEDLRETGAPLAVLASVAAEEIWDDRARREVLDRISAIDREQGALYALRTTLLGTATSDLWAGDFAAAEACHAEMEEIVAVMGLPAQGPVHRVELLAWQGREAEARAAADLVARFVERTGVGAMVNRTLHALAVLDLSLGRYPEALAGAVRVYEDDPPCYGNLILPIVVEAAIRTGDADTARLALDRLAVRSQICPTPWALGLYARCRALLAEDGQGGEELFREAIAHLGRTVIVTELARTHLLYGEWLRRRRRRTAARAQLRTAYGMFTTMGAAGFAERARTELMAIGDRTPRRSPYAAEHDLTPQERSVAALAATGATNAEIATRLFITTSTVEYHLNKVFRKLTITSRRHLATALHDPDQPT